MSLRQRVAASGGALHRLLIHLWKTQEGWVAWKQEVLAGRWPGSIIIIIIIKYKSSANRKHLSVPAGVFVYQS